MTEPDQPEDGAAGEPHAAERTCVGCGQHDHRSALIRLVTAPDGTVVVDLRGRLPGRGAWIHPDRQCVGRLAQDPRRLARTLKARVRADDLEQRLVDAVLRAVLDGMSLASAAGALVGGHDAVEAGIRNGRIVEIVFAADAAERTVGDIQRNAADCPITRLPLDKDTLGERVGQPSRAVLGVTGASGFRHLREQLRRLRSLG